ncbi:MAG: hypothetical protein R8K47_01845, partial [Mariprofundaceae bacterium]
PRKTLKSALRSMFVGMGGEMFINPWETTLAGRLRVRGLHDGDLEALRDDWIAIGRDFRASIGKIETEIQATRPG